MRTVIALCFLLLPLHALAQTIDTPPRLVGEAPVTYPERALSARVESSVLFEIDIDAAGKVIRSSVVEPSDHPDYGFEEAAQEALSRFTFEPARAQGVPTPVRIQYRYRFVLPPLPEPPPPPTPTSPEPSQAAAPVAGPAETGELSGAILERGTRSMLPGMLVVIEQGKDAFEALTDAQGKFAFYDLAPGAWSLSVSGEGYLSARGSEQVSARERTELTLYVERTADNPYDVIVEGAATQRVVTRHRLDVKEVQTQPGTFGDPILAIENLPGIAVVPFDTAGIAMRGAAPDESAPFIEGFRVPLLYHFVGLRSVMAPGMLESIDIYPGGAPVSYGRQLGGVLDAHVKRRAPDRLHGYVDISMLDAGAFVEVPVSKTVSVAAAARMSYLDRILNAFDQPAARYDDYQLLINARPSPKHGFRLFYLGSDDSFKMDTDDLREESAQITFGNIEASTRLQHVMLEHEYAPSEKISNRAQVGFQHVMARTHLGDDARIDFSLNTFLGRNTLRMSPEHWLTIELGADAELGRINTDVLVAQPPKEGEPDGYVDFARERRRHNSGLSSMSGGAWASFELRPIEQLLIVPGVRGDVQAQIHEVTFDPRISVRYAVHRMVALKAASAVNHAAPTIDESAKRFGNPNLGAERSWQQSGGVELMPFDFLKLDLTGFYHTLDGLTAPSDRVVRVGDRSVALEYENTGEGRAYGFEAMLRQELAYRLSGWVAYTLSRAERRRTEDEDYRLFDVDQTHNLVLVAAYHLPRHWQLSTRFRYRTGQPSTPVVGATFVSDTDEYAPVFGGINSKRFDAFHQLDIRIDKQWVFDRWSFTGYLDVQNVYNHRNSISLAYNYDYSKSGKVGGLPLVTILGFKAEY
jgi:TonB family protein